MDDHSQNWQASRMAASTTQASQSQRRSDESWVEIASQPSSSSLSSIGDEIVTTGLRVSGPLPRRRRSYPARYPLRNNQRQYQGNNPVGGMSSQEEYEASESEEDRNLASSTENMPTQLPSTQLPTLSHFEAPAESDTDDDDENATALGTRRRSNDHSFRPQPNAFSNPPAGMGQRSHSMNASSTPSQHPHSGVARRPLGNRGQARVRQPNYMSPSYQADNDAALRASLTTLLSCAAAARGLPKTKEDEGQKTSPTAVGVGPSNQPVELRLVPESELMNEGPPAPPATNASSPPSSRPRTTTTSSGRSSSRGSAEKGKRAAATPARGSRASKKKKTVVAEDALISSTLMTWVVSAGVVVLVSVVGFGAGYVIGREVGRQEVLSAGAGTSLNASDTSCGRDVMRSSGGGLRRWRWGSSMKTVVA